MKSFERIGLIAATTALGFLAMMCSDSGSGGGMAGSSSTTGGGSSTSASGGTNGGGESTAATFADVSSLLQARCATCHVPGGPNVNLSNADNMLYSRLTTPIDAPIPKCQGRTLVIPNDTTNSLIANVVQAAVSDTEHDCTVARMPFACSGSTCLSAADIQTITSWIAAGAPQ